MTELAVELVLFDLDGTLVDSATQLYKAVNLALADAALPAVSEQQVKCWIGNGADLLVTRAILRRHVGAEVPRPPQFAQVRAAFSVHYAAGLHDDIHLYPGVADTLRTLHQAGLQLALVTNKPDEFVPGLLQAAGLDDLFALTLGGDSLPVRKPDPAPLLHVCRQLDVLPAASLMVGDSRNDVLAARAAGMRVVGLTYGYNHGEPIALSQPDWILDHFADLTGLLLGQQQGIEKSYV